MTVDKTEKIIPQNFGHIGHLTGSKIIDEEDKMLPLDVQDIFIKKKRDKNDIVIVTEKIDGMNVGVVKKAGKLYGVNRRGYLTRTMGRVRKELSLLGKCWDLWIDLHKDIYSDILKDGERLVFEDCIMKHTLSYRFRTDPVFLLAKYNADGFRISYSELRHIGESYGLAMPPLLNYGCAIAPEIVLSQYPNGLVGSKNKIEGIVYVYEHNNQFQGSAKYVSNKIMGVPHPDLNSFNTWEGVDLFTQLLDN